MADEPDLPARVYWAVALLAIVVMLLLGWFTAVFNVTAGHVG